MNGSRLVAPDANPSGGGFTDWFIQQFGRPGLTPELGRSAGETNVPLSEWGRIWKRNQNTGWMLASEAYKLWMGRQKATSLNTEVRLVAIERAYKQPSLESAKLGNLYAGKYTVTREKGDWLELQTAAGVRWISSRAILRSPFESPETDTLTIGPDTELYDSPLAVRPSKLKLEQQPVIAVDKWNDWYLIVTAKGSFWVKASEVLIQPQPPTGTEQPEPDKPAAPDSSGNTGSSGDAGASNGTGAAVEAGVSGAVTSSDGAAGTINQ
jgi:g-D-glutamyl-meso-diaminopimelate peptidase